MSNKVLLTSDGIFQSLPGDEPDELLTWDGTDWVSAPLPNVGTAGTYGSADSVPVLTTDAQGRVIAASNEAIQIDQAQVTGLETTLDTKADKTTSVLAGIGLAGGGDLSADVTLELADLSPDPSGTYSNISSLSIDSFGRVLSVIEGNVGDAQPYDFFIQGQGTIGLDDQIFKGKATRDFAFSTTAADHKFTCDTAPSGGLAVFTVYRDADVVMTATFADGDTVATVSVTSANVGVAEDLNFRVVCTSGPNGIANVYVTLRGAVADVIPTLTTYAQTILGNFTVSGPMDVVLDGALTWIPANYVLFTYTGSFSGNISDLVVDASATGLTAGALVHDTTNKRIIVPLT
jgi:hypothetical protein